jgi:hypothetical protein
MELFTVACLNSEICGTTMTFDNESDYEVFGDDYMCGECYDSEEMEFYELTGWSDSDALASAGHGMDEDY